MKPEGTKKGGVPCMTLPAGPAAGGGAAAAGGPADAAPAGVELAGAAPAAGLFPAAAGGGCCGTGAARSLLLLLLLLPFDLLIPTPRTMAAVAQATTRTARATQKSVLCRESRPAPDAVRDGGPTASKSLLLLAAVDLAERWM